MIFWRIWRNERQTGVGAHRSMAVLMTLVFAHAATALGQDGIPPPTGKQNPATNQPPSSNQPRTPAGQTSKRAEPRAIAPKTRDGVQLAVTYYPPTKPSKDVVPVILLHPHKGSRTDFRGLAQRLQDAGHAAIVPDLRGHGQSTRQTQRDGREREIDPALLTKNDLMAMAQYDVEACKSFLMEKNNAGELNIDKLCVVGAEMGAIVAANWAQLDWSWLPLATGKQGQDVKALVLLSPPKTFKGLTITKVLANRGLASRLSWLVVYGTESSAEMRDARAISNQLEKWLPSPPPDEALEKEALFIVPLETNLQGTKLLAEANFNVPNYILKFIERRLTDKPFPWAERRTIP